MPFDRESAHLPVLSLSRWFGLSIRLALGAALLAAAPPADAEIGRAGRGDRHAWRAGAERGFHASALRQSGRAEGRPARPRLSRRVRQPEPLQRQGLVDRAGPRRQRLSVADGALRRRAVHALRPDRGEPRDRPGARQGRLPPQPGGAFFRRLSDHLGRRPLHLQSPEGEGPAAAAGGLQPRQERRCAGRPHGALRPFGRERPRAAADPRDHAGPVPRPHRRRAFRGSDPADSGRLGALSGRRGEAGRAARAPARSRTTGPATCRSPRASTTSIRSASTTSATRTRCSRRSRRA